METFRVGLIVNHREYRNPQGFLKAMNGGSFTSE